MNGHIIQDKGVNFFIYLSFHIVNITRNSFLFFKNLHGYKCDIDFKSLSQCSCGSVVEHCICYAKGCGFDSQGTHVLMKMYNLNAIVSCFG